MTQLTVLLAGVAALIGAQQPTPQPVPPSGATASPSASPIAGDAEAGHDVYAEDCRTCHAGAIAPTLKGVVGRPIASVPGYAYSDALKAKASMSWTPASLDTFLIGPQAFAPGTKMQKVVADPQQRADLIAYLQSLSSGE